MYNLLKAAEVVEVMEWEVVEVMEWEVMEVMEWEVMEVMEWEVMEAESTVEAAKGLCLGCC